VAAPRVHERPAGDSLNPARDQVGDVRQVVGQVAGLVTWRKSRNVRGALHLPIRAGAPVLS